MKIEDFRGINRLENLLLTKHGRQRLIERGISIHDVVACINNGEIIKEYEDDKPYPSCLILGQSIEGNPLHIVVSENEGFINLITAYYPNTTQWKEDYKTRRE